MVIRRVDDTTLRYMFNTLKCVERAEEGLLIAIIVDDRHPSAPLAREPFCTHSQMISYLDRSGNEVARAHQYLRPDNTIGLSGKPDPKRVFLNGTLYLLQLPNAQAGEGVSRKR